MSNVGNKYKIGVLVVISGVLLVFGLIALGIMKYFSESYEFMTVVPTSVQGLHKGSQVKYKGVPVGKVTNIQISQMDENIYIYMVLDASSFDDSERNEIKAGGGLLYLDNELKKYVDQGMRCQLKYAGITGDLYVEIGMYDPIKFPVKEFDLPNGHPPYLPSIPQVSFGEIMDAANKALMNIAMVDFKGLAKKMETFLDSADKFINNEDLWNTVKELRTVTQNLSEVTATLRKFVTDENIDKMISKTDAIATNINRTLDEINTLSQRINHNVEEAKIPETAKKTRELIVDAARSLDELQELMESIKELADYIEENPNSIIVGKSQTPVVKP